MKWKKGLTGMLLAAFLCGGPGLGVAPPAYAATGEYKFGFGGGTVEAGYTGVSALLSYDKSRGYGFRTPENMRNVSASGTGVACDAVQFMATGTKSKNTFDVTPVE